MFVRLANKAPSSRVCSKTEGTYVEDVGDEFKALIRFKETWFGDREGSTGSSSS
jgi:hypothetical protein